MMTKLASGGLSASIVQCIDKRFLVGGTADPDQFFAAEQADRVDFVEQAAGIVLQIADIEFDQRKGVVESDAGFAGDLRRPARKRDRDPGRR